jgi:hypothetical protein
MGNNTWDNVLDPHPTSRGTAKNTFTAYQDVAGTAATNPLPMTYANELKIGTRIEIEARGEFSTTGTPTLQIGAIYGATAGAAGGTALAQSGAITTGTTAAAWPWHYNISGIVTAVGTSGIFYCQGILDLGTSLTAVASSWCPTTAAARSVTINTTIAASWGLGAAFSVSSVSNQVIVDVFTVHVLNQGKT